MVDVDRLCHWKSAHHRSVGVLCWSAVVRTATMMHSHKGFAIPRHCDVTAATLGTD